MNHIKEPLTTFDTQNPPQTHQNSFWKLTKYALMVIAAIGIKIWQPLAIAYAKDGDNYRYHVSAMVLITQIAKLIVCSLIFYIIRQKTPFIHRKKLTDLPFLTSLHFLVPSILYAISNTLVYIGISYINPAFFHVFGNVRIVIAGILSRLMLGKTLNDVQWASLFLLVFGALLSNPEIVEKDIADGSKPLVGMLLLALMSLCSTCASIYTQKYYKKTEELSIFYQNCVMYMYGIVVNLVIILVSQPKLIYEFRIFQGFDGAAFQVLFVQGSMGIILSFVFKFLDNLVYVMSLTVSMIITALFSVFFFDFEFTFMFGCSIMIVTTAIYLYYREKILESLKLDPHNINL